MADKKIKEGEVNKQELLDKAKEDYQYLIRGIEVTEKFYNKLKPMIPKGWEFEVRPDAQSFYLNLSRKAPDGEKNPINEFKLLCKIVGQATGWVPQKGYRINEKTNQFDLIEAYTSFRIEDIWFFINVKIFNPNHSCDVTWKRKWSKVAVVDDACLGFNSGEAL